MLICTPKQHSQQPVLVLTSSPDEAAQLITEAGFCGAIILPEIPPNLASDLTARIEVRNRIASHVGPVVVGRDLDISPHFLTACVPQPI